MPLNGSHKSHFLFFSFNSDFVSLLNKLWTVPPINMKTPSAGKKV